MSANYLSDILIKRCSDNIAMCSPKEDKHFITILPLADKEDPLIVPSDKETVKSIKEILRKLAKPQRCKVCGGLLPELGFAYKGKEYRFVCYYIEENGKVIACTDYERFSKYCASRMRMNK